jgi:hypothetical protein
MVRQFKTAIAFKDFDSQIVMSIYIDSTMAAELSMQLMLLRERLVSSIELKFDNATIFLKASENNLSKCSLFNAKEKIFKANISINTLEYFMYFLLKYYRDGIAEVQHLDLDFEYNDDKEITLTVIAKNHIVHSKEAMNKLLDK